MRQTECTAQQPGVASFPNPLSAPSQLSRRIEMNILLPARTAPFPYKSAYHKLIGGRHGTAGKWRGYNDE